MTLQACYAAMGGNYDDVLGRLRSERLVEKFVLKFLDEGSFDLLKQSMASKDRETAFRAAHTIKGVCSNLGFTALGQSSSALTEELRNDWGANADALFAQVEADYAQVMAAIQAYRAELPQA